MRNLAAAVQAEEGLPSLGVQGFRIERERLDDLIAELAELPASKRASIKGIKYARADLILAGAIVVQSVLEAGGFDAIEVTEAGLREGVFFATLLDGDPPLFDDVRRSSMLNLAARYRVDPAHTEHVCRLALGLFDELAAAGLHDGRPLGARAVVVRVRAARHRHVGRLRRPPQALALPHPQRRPAGLRAARGRAHRAGGALSPQGHAGLRRARSR